MTEENLRILMEEIMAVLKKDYNSDNKVGAKKYWSRHEKSREFIEKYVKEEVTIARNAENLITQAKSWIGCKESDGSHKKIIDVYNSHKPLARGYKVSYTDAWCATFVSACAIKTGMTDIIPTECGCPEMVQKFKTLGEWQEDESIKPEPGWIIFYDWQDSGSGNNTGTPDHVGIVEKVGSKNITVIEGNKNDAVGRRSIAIGGKYIRGYGIPKLR